MAARPIVDRIEQDHGTDLKVMRVNVLEAGSRPLMARFGFRYTPTFILLDGQGEEILRSVGAIDPLEVDQLLAENP